MIRQVRHTSDGQVRVAIDAPVEDEFILPPGWALQCGLGPGGKIEVVAIAPNGQRTLLIPPLILRPR